MRSTSRITLVLNENSNFFRISFLICQLNLCLHLVYSKVEKVLSAAERATGANILSYPSFSSGTCCPNCGVSLMDVTGDHTITRADGHDIMARHSNIKNLLFCNNKNVNLNLVFKTISVSVSDHRILVDITVHKRSGGSLLPVDVILSSPLQTSLITLAVKEPGITASTNQQY